MNAQELASWLKSKGFSGSLEDKMFVSSAVNPITIRLQFHENNEVVEVVCNRLKYQNSLPVSEIQNVVEALLWWQNESIDHTCPKLLLMVAKNPDPLHYVGHNSIGVLLTCCYPACYYAGYIRPLRDGSGDWWQATNETSNFHRTYQEAVKAAEEQVKRSGW